MTRPHPWEALYPPRLAWDFAPPRATLADHAARAAARFGDAPFLDYRGKIITFSEFSSSVTALAAGLLAFGGPGQKIALYLPNTPYYPQAFFAVLKAGGVVVNLSPLDAERVLIHKLNDSGARVIVTTNFSPLFAMARNLLAGGHVDRIIVGDDGAFGTLPAGAPALAPIPRQNRHVIWLDHLLPAAAPAAWPEVAPDDLAVLQYTGGTTGLPKGAMHSHASLLAAAGIYDQFYDGQTEEEEGPQRVIAVLPFFHIYALVVLLLWQMGRGALLFVHPRFDPRAVLHDIEVKRATYFPGVPTMWIALAALPDIGQRDLSSLRHVASGGAPLPPEVAARFETVVGRRIGGGWGMTETAAAGTVHLMAGRFDETSVGVPLPGFAIRIVALDDPHRELGAGEIGEIVCRGPNLFSGYWRREAESAADFADGWFRTGDIGRMDAQGMVFLVDRKKDMIISAGFNVYPRMIEDAVYEHPDVAECCVIGVADVYRGQSAKAFIKLRDGAAEFSLDQLNAFLMSRLGRHELPSALEFRDALPKTPVGKLSKTELIEEQRRLEEVAARRSMNREETEHGPEFIA